MPFPDSPPALVSPCWSSGPAGGCRGGPAQRSGCLWQGQERQAPAGGRPVLLWDLEGSCAEGRLLPRGLRSGGRALSLLKPWPLHGSDPQPLRLSKAEEGVGTRQAMMALAMLPPPAVKVEGATALAVLDTGPGPRPQAPASGCILPKAECTPASGSSCGRERLRRARGAAASAEVPGGAAARLRLQHPHLNTSCKTQCRTGTQQPGTLPRAPGTPSGSTATPGGLVLPCLSERPPAANPPAS